MAFFSMDLTAGVTYRMRPTLGTLASSIATMKRSKTVRIVSSVSAAVSTVPPAVVHSLNSLETK